VPEPVVVDTNVLLVAEGVSSYSARCRANCGKLLEEVKASRTVVLDRDRLILGEYARNLSGIGKQPGLGYEFWKWLLNSKLSHSHCEYVNLTPHDDRGFDEFPDHLALKNFDNADRKFVAVAAAHPGKPEIVQAGDSKWWGWKTALEECGINLNLPCEDELKAKWEAKIGRNV
jgi:hypothetical protein